MSFTHLSSGAQARSVHVRWQGFKLPTDGTRFFSPLRKTLLPLPKTLLQLHRNSNPNHENPRRSRRRNPLLHLSPPRLPRRIKTKVRISSPSPLLFFQSLSLSGFLFFPSQVFRFYRKRSRLRWKCRSSDLLRSASRGNFSTIPCISDPSSFLFLVFCEIFDGFRSSEA